MSKLNVDVFMMETVFAGLLSVSNHVDQRATVP